MKAQSSPYRGKPESRWPAITKTLIARHPLTTETLRDVAIASWKRLWQTTIGEGAYKLSLSELDVPAMVIGYLFEVLVGKDLELRFPGMWRGSASKAEKDLVHLPDRQFSIEMKSSGQRGDKIFGNRSAGQRLLDPARSKKEKSGYYLTANFTGRTLRLLRFGWIDEEDWQPQGAPTGQMSALPTRVYKGKLVTIPGDYRLDASVDCLPGVGPQTVKEFGHLGIRTLRELLAFKDTIPTRLDRVRKRAFRELQG